MTIPPTPEPIPVDGGVAATSMPASTPAPQNSVSGKFIAAYFFAQVAAWTGIITPVVVTIALQVTAITEESERAAQLGIVLAIGAFAALIAAPIWGAVSDRTTLRFGRRRTWMVGGALFLLVGLLIMAFAPNILLFGIGWFICQFGSNANQAALNAVMPDVVPDHQRGRVSGLLGISTTFAVLMGTFVTQFTAGNPFLMFIVPWLLIPIAVTIMCILFKDKPADRATLPAMNLAQVARTFWVSPRKHPDFAWAFTSRFFVFLGIGFLGSYQVFFLTDQIGISIDEVATYVFIATLVTAAIGIVVSLLGGYLSDRFRRRKPFVLGAAVVAGAGLIVIGSSTTFEQFLVGASIVSIGSGIYYAVDIALVVAVLPDPNDAAKDMGVFQIANSAPQSLAPAIAPLFLGIGATATGNYPAVFIAGAIFAAIGALAILPIRKSR